MIFIALTLSVFLFMEAITWCTHKYIMHGFGWYLHEDHHKPDNSIIFERNDIFFVIFAIPSMLLFYFGVQPELNFLFFIGLGIMMYGAAYFLIHDVLIHRRFKWFRNTTNRYLLGLRRAHKIHHKHLEKFEGECFGMLFVPFKYFKKTKR